jgi:hypothetical protein
MEDGIEEREDEAEFKNLVKFVKIWSNLLKFAEIWWCAIFKNQHYSHKIRYF